MEEVNLWNSQKRIGVYLHDFLNIVPKIQTSNNKRDDVQPQKQIKQKEKTNS